MSRRELAAVVAHAPVVMPNGHDQAPEAPRPLTRPPEPAGEYPLDALGGLLGAAAEAIQDIVKAPRAICGNSVLATSALCTQAFADIVLPMGQSRPLSLYCFTVAASGERKSSTDREALRPVEAWERQLEEKYKSERASYESELKAWKSAQQEVAADKKIKGREAKMEALQSLGPPPVAPLDPMITAPEPTYEGLTRLLHQGQPSVGVFSAEGGQFVGGHGMNAENKLKTAAAMSDVWDAGRIKRLRAGDGAMILRGRRVSLHLMAQHDVAMILLSDPLLADQGLLSRLLVTAPDTTAGTRLWREPAIASHEALAAYNSVMGRILATDPPKAVDSNGEVQANELAPRALTLTPSARALWITYADHVERQIAPGGQLEPVRACANKLAEQAARIAGILTLVDDLAASQVDERHLERAIALADHYAGEALRLAKSGFVDPDVRLAQRLLDHLQRRWPEPLVSLPDIYQSTLNAISDKKTAKKLVAVLEDHGWLTFVDGGGIVRGQSRRDVWRIEGKGSVQ